MKKFIDQFDRCAQMKSGIQCVRQRNHDGECFNLHERWQRPRRFETDNFLADALAENRILSRPILSWRWWRLGTRGRLRSITATKEWYGPTMTIKQNPSETFVPIAPIISGPASHWGVFSYKTPLLLAGYDPYFASIQFPILGRGENRGQVIEHEYGYRSQSYTIKDLWVVAPEGKTPSSEWLTLLADTYELSPQVIPEHSLQGWIRFYSDPSESPPPETFR
jgi:hypothetical protein